MRRLPVFEHSPVRAMVKGDQIGTWPNFASRSEHAMMTGLVGSPYYGRPSKCDQSGYDLSTRRTNGTRLRT